MAKTIQEQYNQIKKGKGNKEIFLKEVKRNYPHMIVNSATFDKAEEILLMGYKNCNENQLFNLKLSEFYYETGRYLNEINYCRQYLGKSNNEKGKFNSHPPI